MCEHVAADDFLVRTAAHARPGQVPTFAFFAAVHAALLAGAEHQLAQYYPSVRGAQARPPDEQLAATLADFTRTHLDAIVATLQTRLVQTNHVQRAVALRLGLATIRARTGGAAVHLLEIGASAGLLLRHDRYAYRLGDRNAGDRTSTVRLRCEWRSEVPTPDLDAIPPIASTTGIDLNPLDPNDPADRRWLEALVWPEDRDKAALLTAALQIARDVPVSVLTGDAVELCPQWAADLPGPQPRVVFHCATRMHVPALRRPDFDAAIAAVGEHAPLYRIANEGDGLVVTGPDGEPLSHHDVDGHLAWAAPSN